MTFSPLPGRRSLREEVTHALRTAIVTGSLRPGTVYSVPTLAADFGVSPTPVREAVLDLAKEGLIQIAKNKGFRISALSNRELDEITEIRALLEIPTVAGLAGRLTTTQLADLRKLAELIVGAARNADLAAYLDADTQFHLTLLRAGGNEQLVSLVGNLRQRTRLYGLDPLLRTGRLAHSAAEHMELVELLAAGDKPAVTLLMRQHLQHVRGIWAGVA